MATYYYVKGNPVPNAQSYRLLKKKNNGDNNDVANYEKVADQEILQKLSIVGALDAYGLPAEQAYDCNQGISQNITPITKLGENGYVYYIRVEGLMDLETDMSTLEGIPFQGTLYLDSASVVSFTATGLKYDTSKKVIQLTATVGGNEKNIDVYPVDLTGAIISKLQIYGGNVTVYASYTIYRRTGFIPIDELTDHLRIKRADGSGYDYYCAGKFSAPALGSMPGYKIAFYSGLSYSTFIEGLKWSDDFSETYLTSEQLKGFAPDGAKYVVFVSNPTTSVQDNSDFVSLGGIYFLLTGNDKFSPGETANIAVQAVGDGKFFTDSLPSNVVTYNVPTT